MSEGKSLYTNQCSDGKKKVLKSQTLHIILPKKSIMLLQIQSVEHVLHANKNLLVFLKHKKARKKKNEKICYIYSIIC
jgi:hypothetical protein